jgi:hypothetical protein
LGTGAYYKGRTIESIAHIYNCGNDTQPSASCQRYANNINRLMKEISNE